MPNFPRTDLAVEAEAIHRSAAAVTELPGAVSYTHLTLPTKA